MIIDFKIFERLGYNEEVSKLAEFVWTKYKEGEREIDLSEYSKNNLTIFINKLIIVEFHENSDARMSAYYDNSFYKKTKNFKITINKKFRTTLMSLEHELKHMFDFIKAGGEFLNVKDKKLLSPFNIMSSNDKFISKFFLIMYYIQITEIEAYYHSDIRNFKNNKHKFNNNIKTYIKYSRLKNILNLLTKYDLKGNLFSIQKNDKLAIMNYYYQNLDRFKKYMSLSDTKFKITTMFDNVKKFLQKIYILPDDWKNYSDEEIDRFFKRFEKEIENKKGVYKKYINRLYSYFNEK